MQVTDSGAVAEKVGKGPRPLLGEKFPRDCHHRPGVHSAAEHRAHRSGAAQATTYRFGEHLQKRLRVRLVGRQAQLRTGFKRPIAPLAGAVRRHRHRMGRRQAIDLDKEAAGFVDAFELVHQEIGDAALVDPIGDLREDQDRPRFGRESEETPFRMVIVEGPHAKVVAGAKEGAAAGVPDGEREVAEQAFDAGLAPCEVGRQDNLHVTDGGGALGEPQSCEQFVAVVQANVAGNDAAGGAVAKRQPL